MSHQIKKLENGRYSVFSTISDGVILSNATRDDIIQFELEIERENVIRVVNRMCDMADRQAAEHRGAIL